ncbi:MAG: glycosyltransferase [Rikenellaceae bacterium]|nr:glycosyltransferase [Rikenellaceae bacterium]
MTLRISVIIPVYNAEQFLAQCVDSVLAQNGLDFEVLLINDGSRDRSLEICQNYAAQDPRVRVFDKPNGGVSSARNMGLDNALGEWVMFVDADDGLAAEAFEVLSPHLADNDVVRFSSRNIFADGGVRYRRLTPAANRDESFAQVIGHRSICAAWSGVFRRAIFEQHKVRFSTQLTYGEDWLVLATILFHSSKVVTLHDAHLYIYNRGNDTSCTNTMTSGKLIQSMLVVRMFREMVGEGCYVRELSHSRCRRVGMLIKHCGHTQTARELLAVRDKIDMLTLQDILTSRVHLSLRFRLLRFWLIYLKMSRSEAV